MAAHSTLTKGLCRRTGLHLKLDLVVGNLGIQEQMTRPGPQTINLADCEPGRLWLG